MNITTNFSVYSNVSTQFDTASKMTWCKILLGIFLFSNMMITFFGNLLVLMAVYREKILQTAFNFFIVNLAVTDIAVALTAMSFYATDKVIGYWPFGSFLCTIWILFDYGMTFASVFTLVAISSDRFWSVFWSLSYRSVNKKKKSVAMLGTVWLTTIVLWAPPLVVDRINNPQPAQVCMWDPAHNRHFVFIIAIVGHHGPCVLMLFFYFLVFFYLRRRMKFGLMRSTQVVPASKSINESSLSENGCKTSNDCTAPSVMSSVGDQGQKPSCLVQEAATNYTSTVCQRMTSSINLKRQQSDTLDGTGQDRSLLQVPSQRKVSTSNKSRSTKQISNEERRTNREMRVFLTMTYIIVGYLICWVPFHIVFDISAVDPDLVPNVVYDMTFWLTYVNSTINPFLYNFCSPDFRRAFKNIIFRTRLSSRKDTGRIHHKPNV